MKYDLFIKQNGLTVRPPVEEGITLTTERFGVPGKLTFTVAGDFSFSEGAEVGFSISGTGIFFGYIFTIKKMSGGRVSVTAYDQLRYLKNRDTYVYSVKTAGEVLRMIAEDFKLSLGVVDHASYVIPFRVEDNVSLFDILGNALDIEAANTGRTFVIYDDFGKICMKSEVNMRVPIIIGEQTCSEYTYTSTVDETTYNQIKLVYSDKKGGREVFIVKNDENIRKWGMLQYGGTVKEGENGAVKADALLRLYNSASRRLKIGGIPGDIRVKGGSSVAVRLGDFADGSYMTAEKCTHIFGDGLHLMELELRGGAL